MAKGTVKLIARGEIYTGIDKKGNPVKIAPKSEFETDVETAASLVQANLAIAVDDIDGEGDEKKGDGL